MAKAEELGAETTCHSSTETGPMEVLSTLYASSADKERRARVNATRIQKSLETLRKNRELRRRGLG